MEPRISIVTLGVSDLDRSRTFYRKLGWKESASSNDGVVFFQAGCLIFGLYPRDKLAEDAQVPDDGSGFRAFSLAYNVRSKDDVNAILDEAVAVRGTLVKAAEDVF
ncbi:MAG: VOC family protein, partial [Pseudomonadota bacterium]